jgi:heparanase 1
MALPLFAQMATKIEPGKMPAIAHVDARFQSYNIEMIEVTGGRFWAPYKAKADEPADKQQAGPAGMPASLYRYRPPVDLENPRLQKLAAALGPAYVRVSGTWANSTYFWDSDAPAPEKPPAGFNGVLTRKEWRGVVDFARAADARLVTSFAISPGVRNGNGVWTSKEAEKVLAYTESIGGNIAAAEMFNEPTYASMGGAPKGYDAEAYGRDFKAFVAYIKNADPKLLVLGPGGVGEAGGLGQAPGMKLIRSEDILRDEGPGLDAFSYHYYGGVSQRCARMGAGALGMTPEKALTEHWLTLTLRDEEFYAGLRNKYLPGKPIWLTETAETACGGDPWAADFIDSFRYLTQLGELAQKNVQVVMHNTLDASDYGLLDENTLEPRPNYWAAVLWRRLMGTTVLDPGAGKQPNLYVFAQCLRGKRGGVAVLAINADREQAGWISLPKGSTRYTLTAPNLMGTAVDLNGAELKAAADGSLPAMEGVAQSAGTVDLKPLSITFFAVPGAENSACR